MRARRDHPPSYQPLRNAPSATPGDKFFRSFRNGELTVDQVVSHYAALVYSKTGSYERTATRLGIDRRTVKAKVEKFLRKQYPPGA